MDLTCKAIQERQSCRWFDCTKEVSPSAIEQLIYSASLAPSGKNLQPWKFRVVNENEFGSFLHELLPNNKWIKDHKQFICIFLDSRLSYDTIKDYMSIAAAIENILIEAKCNDIDTCWIGECTEYSDKICKQINVDCKYHLLAIIAVGYAKRKVPLKCKRELNEIII
jgi:nitroreductase